MITSLQNPKIQRVRALLAHRQERADAQSFVVEGVRLTEEALDCGQTPNLVMFSDQLSERGRKLLEAFSNMGSEIEEISPQLMQTIAGTQTPQGILAVLPLRPLPLVPAPDFVIIADNLRDPGNLGTLLRTAAAAGAQAVLLSPGTTDAYAPKVLRSGMGAHFRLAIHTLSWEEIAYYCHNQRAPLSVYLADAQGEMNCWQVDMRAPLALMIGGEADGAGSPGRQLADHTVSIPMPGQFESLNAAVAASILIFEVVRQRSTL